MFLLGVQPQWSLLFDYSCIAALLWCCIYLLRCVVIEDSGIGVRAAKGAGMTCVVTKSFYTQLEDFSNADAVYDCIGEAGEERFSLADLVKLLEVKTNVS